MGEKNNQYKVLISDKATQMLINKHGDGSPV